MAGVGPQVVQVLDFATARAPELQALHELARHKDLGSAEAHAKLASQRNQRRRRANAFKSHAMPRRLRLPLPGQSNPTAPEELIALGTRHGGRTASVVAATAAESAARARAKRDQKPRCRKHRRRMHVLLHDHSWTKQPPESSHGESANAEGDAEEESPLETPKWLPTHAWHAKRMQMRERFGHVLAQRRQDKSVSAALTALRKNATLHDASYYGLLELYGLDTLILEVLQLVTDPSGSDVDDEGFFAGDREGRSVLYHLNQFPSGAIAPVSFMWRPLNGPDAMETVGENEDEERRPRKRQLWLWIHAAAFMEAATAIASACHEVLSDYDDTERIEILDRRGHVARFQLRGKGANAMVDKVLRSLSAKEQAEEDSGDEPSDHEDGFSLPLIRKATATTNLSTLRDNLSDAKHRTEHDLFSVRVQDPRLRSQSSQELGASRSPPASLLHEPSAAQLDAALAILCPLSGLCLTVGDAEEPDSALILAQLESLLQWTTTAKDNASTPTYPFVSPALSPPSASDSDVPMADTEPLPTQPAVPCSELCSLSGRERARRTFLRDHELNRIKASRADDDDVSWRPTGVPVILVRQPGAFKHTGGWDLILNPVHAPVFLNALVFSGAMVIGLDEHEAMATVAHEPSFPRDFPDTTAGRVYWDQLGDALESEYVKKPKAKRVAYDKLGVECPFQPNWEVLFGETDAEDSDIAGAEDEEMESPPLSLCVLRSAGYMEPFPFSRGDETKDQDNGEPMELIPVAVPTLIRAALAFPRRSALESCSMLYVPTTADLTSFYEDAKWTGRQWDAAELDLLGFVTSAVYDRPMGAFRGTAFCACEPLQRLALAQLPIHRTDKKTSGQLLALTRTPTSRQLRPVLLHILA